MNGPIPGIEASRTSAKVGQASRLPPLRRWSAPGRRDACPTLNAIVRLAELGLGRQTLALALVGFNLGVELGQLAIVAVFLPLAFGLRDSWIYQRLTFRFGSALIS